MSSIVIKKVEEELVRGGCLEEEEPAPSIKEAKTLVGCRCSRWRGQYEQRHEKGENEHTVRPWALGSGVLVNT